MVAPRSLGVLTALAALACFVGCSDDEEEPVIEDPLSESRETDAGSQPVPDATPSGPKVDCSVGTAVEVEDNDAASRANAFTELAYCGVLEPVGDVDYSTFETPQGTRLRSFQAVVNGKVDFELTVNGATFGPAEVDRFTAGKYVVRAFTKSGQPASYRYRLVFVPL